MANLLKAKDICLLQCERQTQRKHGQKHIKRHIFGVVLFSFVSRNGGLGLPACKSFSGENNKVEKISDHSEKAHGRYSVSVDDVTNDVIVSFRITDAAICTTVVSGFGYLHKGKAINYACYIMFVVHTFYYHSHGNLVRPTNKM